MNLALTWSTHLLGLAVFLQTVELLRLRSSWSDEGVWSWTVVRRELVALPHWAMIPIDGVMNEKSFHGILWVRLFAALIALFAQPIASLPAIFLVTTVLIAFRWRGSFNGGSDSMTAIVSFGLWFACYFAEEPWLAKAGLALIAVELTASYFLAGWAKVRNPEWRSGRALGAFLRTPGYDSPPAWALRMLERPETARRAAIGILAFECLFPLAWIGTVPCAVFLAVGLGFHLAIFRVFGLNRFVFAWLAAFPSLIYWSHWG